MLSRQYDKPPMMPAARRSLRWLAVVLLLFAQLVLAGHYHDSGDIPSHECTLCSQLQSVEHGAVSFAAPPVPTGEATFPQFYRAAITATRLCFLPPCRAPPLV